MSDERGADGNGRSAIALAALCVGGSGLATIAGDTLFVSHFSLGDLSKFLGLSALVRVLASLAYAALAERLVGEHGDRGRAARFDAGVLALTAIASVGSAALALTGASTAILVVCLLQVVLPPLLPLVAFNAATASLAARGARRLLPLVAAAGTIGSIAAGLAATVLAPSIGIASMFVLTAVVVAPAAWLVHRLGAAPDEGAGEPREEPPPPVSGTKAGFVGTLRATASDVRAVPAVRVVVAWGLFGAMAATFVDFAFKASLKESYGPAAIAAYLGVIGIASNALVLLLQVAVTGRLVSKLGVGRTLIAAPVLLAAASAAAVALPPVAGTTLARLTETVARYGFASSVADVILVPLGRAARTRAKVVVKGSATPLGALAAGSILALFGEAGPARTVQLVLVVLASLAAAWMVRGAPHAYAAALGDALARGRAAADVGPEATALYRGEVSRLLREAVAEARWSDAERALGLMTERLFGPEDVAPVLGANDLAVRRAAVLAAARFTAAGKGASLLALATDDPDPELETILLRTAREHGAFADPERRARGIARGEAEGDPALTQLWAECLLHEAKDGVRAREAGGGARAQATVDGALKRLRKAAKEADGPKRAAALTAIGELGDKRAEREVMMATSSEDPRVYREAARAAVLLDLPGAVAGLVARLAAGPHAAIATRCLALAGPRAIRELVTALPVTRGEGAVAPTAVADARMFSGTVRAARALARIGPAASVEVLPLFGQLGHRARVAIAHAFSAPTFVIDDASRAGVANAMGRLVDYGEALENQRRSVKTGGGLLGPEIERRLSDTRGALFDLACVLGERTSVLRARIALDAGGRRRDDALELLEALAPAGLGPRVGALLSGQSLEKSAQNVVPGGAPPPLDGFLDKCRKFDARELPLADPMHGVLDKVLLLREVPLFRGLSGEELYPVAEIAGIRAVDAGAVVVRQGEPSDDLYVVAEGALAVIRDGAEIGRLSAGQAFGELGVLDGEPRAATVEAREPSRLLRIPRLELEALLDESPELARGIIRTLLGYVRAGGGSSAASTKNPQGT